nr:hypothetical protein [Desulfobacterales bacterium]
MVFSKKIYGSFNVLMVLKKAIFRVGPSDFPEGTLLNGGEPCLDRHAKMLIVKFKGIVKRVVRIVSELSQEILRSVQN